MKKNEYLISHVSETALWVAVYRAIETRRRDAIFRDPYAESLAGEKGKRIVDKMKGIKNSAWSVIVRTFVMDEFIMKTINEDNADTVINLAAGLDSRPYRLELHPELNWIEVDLPEIIDYKEKILAGIKPNCSLERVKLDLRDRISRLRLLERIAHDSQRVLIITEGLLVYLSDQDVSSLASDLHSQPNFKWWIMDILSPVLLDWLLNHNSKSFQGDGVKMKFAPEEGWEFFRRFGWQEDQVCSLRKEAKRLKRQIPNAWLFGILSAISSQKRREIFSRLDSFLILLNRG